MDTNCTRNRGLLACCFMMLLGAVLLPRPAAAQLEPTLNVQRFEPAPSFHSFTTTDTALLLPRLGLGFNLTFDYAWRPLQQSTTSLERETGTVDGLVGGHFRVGFGAADWAEINLAFPFMQITQVGAGLEGVNGNRPHYGIGDIVLSGRLRILPEEKGVGIAAIPFVTFPTGSRALYASRGTFTLGARLAVSRHWQVFRFGAHIGYRLVPGSTVVGTAAVDDELLYGAGVGVTVVPDWLDVNLELVGAGIIGPARFNLPDSEWKAGTHSPLEIHANARLKTPIGLDVVLGGGPGLTSAVGTPGFRVFLGISWAPPGAADPDPDKDRIEGDADLCPNEREDKDGFEDSDGCPEPDNDQDGILDREDPCRDVPEDVDGFEDDDGCPDLDNDQDGNPDVSDQCPNEPEDVDMFEDTDGCPDKDNDLDAIDDEDDLCPDRPEDINGIKDDDGCPDEVKAVVKGEKIVILEKILFTTNTADIVKESYSLLEAVQQTLLEHPEITRVRIEGHTDSRAEPDYNLDLSNRRAESVMRFLIEAGVEGSRLEAVGYGETRPIGDNETEEGMQANRRVEFTILSDGDEE